MTRLERKTQAKVSFKAGKKYGIFDGIDLVFMETYRLNEEQFSYLTRTLSDEDTNEFFTNELRTFAEKRRALTILRQCMEGYE